MHAPNRFQRLLRERIVFLDGAMGTSIQALGLTEADFRGERLKDRPDWVSQQGNNDILNITQPQVIREVHDALLRAGADVIETNTFKESGVRALEFGKSGVQAGQFLSGTTGLVVGIAFGLKAQPIFSPGLPIGAGPLARKPQRNSVIQFREITSSGTHTEA